MLGLCFMGGLMFDILSWGTLFRFIEELRSKGRPYKNVLMSFHGWRLAHRTPSQNLLEYDAQSGFEPAN